MTGGRRPVSQRAATAFSASVFIGTGTLGRPDANAERAAPAAAFQRVVTFAVGRGLRNRRVPCRLSDQIELSAEINAEAAKAL
jgi:hypothetical protein